MVQDTHEINSNVFGMIKLMFIMKIIKKYKVVIEATLGRGVQKAVSPAFSAGFDHFPAQTTWKLIQTVTHFKDYLHKKRK